MKKEKINIIADLIEKWIGFGPLDEEERYRDSIQFNLFIEEAKESNDKKLKDCLFNNGKIYRYLHPSYFIKNKDDITFSNLYYSRTKNSDFKNVAKFDENKCNGITILEATLEDDDYGIDVVKFLKYCKRGNRVSKKILLENEVIFPMEFKNLTEVYKCNKLEICENCKEIYCVKITESFGGNNIVTCPYCNSSEVYTCDSKGMKYSFNSKSYKLDEIFLNPYEKEIVKDLKSNK